MSTFSLCSPKTVRLSITLLLLAFVHNSKAQNWNQIVKTAAGDRLTKSSAVRATSDNYGSAVSIDGNYAVVGASFEDEDANELNTLASAGAAYVLYNTGSAWIQVTKLTASTREAVDRFGYSVSISGDYVVVGAQFEDHDASEANSVSDAGAAYIFYRN